MYGYIRERGATRDNTAHFICQNYDDILDLPQKSDHVPFGSSCYVIDEDTTLWMADQWALKQTTVYMPLPSIYPGEILSGTEIELTAVPADADIYYTTDGNTPTAQSTAYDAQDPPTITEDTTLKAIAIKGGVSSLVMTAAYTIPKTIAPLVLPLAGDYLIGQELTMTSPVEGAKIYYTTDGSDPDSMDNLYDPDSKPVLVAGTTIKAVAVVSGYADSDVFTATYTITKAATPVITPAAGAHPKTTEVTMTCATEGADIYYTTNGATPTSTASGTNFKYNPASKPTITGAATFKAKAFKSTHADSDVASNAYTISVAATPVAVPAAGAVADNTEVVLTTETPEAAIYYTIDGSTPNATKTLYEAPIVITDTVTIKAIAIHANYTNSAVLTAAYTIAAE
jgi:hypothetical protein